MVQIGENSTGDPHDVEAIVAKLRDAGRALERRDPDGVVAMFDRRDSKTLFDFLAPGVTSVEEVRRNVAGIAANGVGDLICRYPKITVRVLSRDAAYSLAYSDIDVTTSAGRMQVHTSVTNIWCRVDGEWACVHEHSSLPVDITSGKAKLAQPI